MRERVLITQRQEASMAKNVMVSPTIQLAIVAADSLTGEWTYIDGLGADNQWTDSLPVHIPLKGKIGFSPHAKQTSGFRCDCKMEGWIYRPDGSLGAYKYYRDVVESGADFYLWKGNEVLLTASYVGIYTCKAQFTIYGKK